MICSSGCKDVTVSQPDSFSAGAGGPESWAAPRRTPHLQRQLGRAPVWLSVTAVARLDGPVQLDIQHGGTSGRAGSGRNWGTQAK